MNAANLKRRDRVLKLSPFERLVYWIKERESIRQRKESGLPKPWTDDYILQTYRFCNVHREDDAVTRWIATNWRTPHTDDPDLWFAMVVARWINLPNTLRLLGVPIPWNQTQFTTVLNHVQNQQLVFLNPAYMITTHGVKKPIAQFLCDLLSYCWNNRISLRPENLDTLHSYHDRLVEVNHFGSFMAGQVIADLKYAEGCPLSTADDWHTWAAPGPGSKRGLNRVLDREVNAPWRPAAWLKELQALQVHLGMEDLHAQDLQNCLCEFDKYERAFWGQGRPKKLYQGV